MKTFVPALVAALALGIVGVASASASQHWYVGGSKAAEGSSASETMTGVKTGEFVKTKEGLVEKPSWNMAFTYGGVNVQITCTGQSGSGSVENPLGGGAGLGETPFTLTGCIVATLPTCSVEEAWHLEIGTIGFNKLYEEATEVGGKPAVRLSPLGGGGITTLLFGNKGGGNCPLHATPFTLYGSFTGVQESGSTLTFSAASSEITYGAGYAVSLAGKSTLTSGGSALTLAP